MIQPISNIKEFEEELKRKGEIFYLDELKHIAIMANFNKKMEKVHRDYLRKSAGSCHSAAKVTLC